MSDIGLLIKNLKECDSNEFFTNLEKYLDFKIPQLLQNILKLNSYDCAINISTFDDDSINEITNFMKNDFEDTMIPQGKNKSDYLGLFSTNQNNFKFVSGEMRMLRTISEKCRTLYEIPSPPAPSSAIILQPVTTTSSNIAAISSPEEITTNATDLFNLIASHMITVYNDAKRVTLSAWSWPSRYVSFHMGQQFGDGHSEAADINLNYVTPVNHAEFLDCIVICDTQNTRETLEGSLAVSLRVDGSIDRTQEHNIYAMLHVVKMDCTTTTMFLGFDVPTAAKAEGYVQCVKTLGNQFFPWETLFSLITSAVTDGESLNIGSLTGFCKQLYDMRQKSTSQLPFFSIWCIAHRINLAWKDLSDSNILIEDLFKEARSLSSYFHKSKSSSKLNHIASHNRLSEPLRYPEYFSVRWTQFTHRLIYVILRNWRSSIKLFEQENKELFLEQWLTHDRLHLTTFLTDILDLMKNFQKLCESDSISILDIDILKEKLFQKFRESIQGSVLNGWEQLYLSTMRDDDNGMSFHGYSLTRNVGQRSRFTVEKRKNIIEQLMIFVNTRLEIDSSMVRNLLPFVHIKSTTSQEDLMQCHTFIAPDMDKDIFFSEYYEAAALINDNQGQRQSPINYLQNLHKIAPNQLLTIKRCLARIIAAKPHSADVERLISVYNKFKATDRSSLSPDTLRNYLHVNVNMPSLEKFDPTPAAQYWLVKKNRRPRSHPNDRQQDWFHGVFDEGSRRKHVHKNIVKF